MLLNRGSGNPFGVQIWLESTRKGLLLWGRLLLATPLCPFLSVLIKTHPSDAHLKDGKKTTPIPAAHGMQIASEI